MKFRLYIFFAFVGFASGLGAQIVTIEPAFFTIDDEITVTYDASQGSRGLDGVDQVYAHTGIITTQGGAGNWQNVQGNWGTDDPKVKMTNIGDNKHTLTYTPRDFYSIGASVEVVQLSFVFRNVNGSREGKTANQGDVFVDIPEAGTFTAFFRSPSERFKVAALGETISIDAQASAPARLSLYDNDVLITTVNNEDALITDLIVSDAGDHLLRLEAILNQDTVTDQFSYTVNPALNIVALPEDAIPGWNIESDENAIIVLRAPGKEYVHIVGDFTDWKLQSQYLMNKTPDDEYFWLDVNNLNSNDTYEYQYLIDGEILVADPLSRLILDPNNDAGVPASHLEGLDPYPQGLTEGFVTVASLDDDDFDWQYDSVEMPAEEELIIYEVLLRDFLGDHSYTSLRDTLSYLSRLGVNAIELMPIQEYEANNSWGYNPSFHGALDKYYGSPEQLRQFVDEAHRLGIAVIVDVVYNHAFGQSPLVTMYWDKDNNRPATNSPYFNTTPKHPFNVGFDFNHESNATKDYVKQTLSRWIEDYHIDGFRFDLSKGFTQQFSSDNDVFSSYDASRVGILQDYADHVWSMDADSYVILEHFASNTEERILADYGMLLWGNANGNFNEATMGYHENGKSDFGSIAVVSQRGWGSDRLIGYMESHDEERLMWKNLQFGNSSGNYNTKNRPTALDRIELATAFFLSIPGPKMIWQFGELGYDLSINRCTDGTIREDCRLSDKPIRWEYQDDPDRQQLYKVFSLILQLRKSSAALLTGDYTANTAAAVKEIVRRSDEEDLVVVGNFDVVPQMVTPSFTKSGIWYDFISGDSLMVDMGQLSMTYAPGEYHMYLSTKPDFTVAIEDVLLVDVTMLLKPNPATDHVMVQLSAVTDQVGSIDIIDMQGRLIQRQQVIAMSGDTEVSMELPRQLESGIYIVRFVTDEGVLLDRLVIQH